MDAAYRKGTVVFVHLDVTKCCYVYIQAVDVAPFIKNKMAQIYALVFVVDYPSKVRCT